MLYHSTLCLWVLKVELTSCHPLGTKNFDVAVRFVENLCTPGVCDFHIVSLYCTRKLFLRDVCIKLSSKLM